MSPSSNLLSLPVDIILLIIDHLFISCLPTTEEDALSLHRNSQWSPLSCSPRCGNLSDTYPYSPSAPSRWLRRIRLYVDHDRVTLDPIAGGKHLLPSLKAEERSRGDHFRQTYRGIFTTCRALRAASLDLWLDKYVVFELRENSRRASWFEEQAEHRRASKWLRRKKLFAKATAVTSLAHGQEKQGEEGILQRVRNCEVFLEVHDEDEMQKTPERLAQLMRSLTMDKMKYFRSAFRFVATRFDTTRSYFGQRNYVGGIHPQTVAEDTWTAFINKVEQLDLQKFCGKADRNDEGWPGDRWHVIFVGDSWEYGEGGFARFETLADLIGAVVDTEDGRLVDGLPASRWNW